ncbi:MAG: ribonuclease H-like YkuK family protein [Patescibacteria group bacterium]
MLAKETTFISPTVGELSVPEMISEIEEFVNHEPRSFYRLVIGTDSQTRSINGHAEIDFVTAIIVHRRGKGARYFWKKVKKQIKVPVLRDKIYTETNMSLEVAQDMVPEIRKRITPAKYDFEIHIDVGPIGPTRDMIREVVGMVNGNGFVAKTKPESWGASSVADKHT